MAQPRTGRFDERDFAYWVDRVGQWFDSSGPAGNHLIESRRVELTMLTGCYIGVQRDGRPLYVGKVKRQDAGLDDRLRCHDQPIELFDSVWLLPFQQQVPGRLLLYYESRIIARHLPEWNVMHRPVVVA